MMQIPTSNPLGMKSVTSFDNDCDGLTDDEDDSLIAASTTTYYADNDRDGYGDEGMSVDACLAPVGYIDVADDCDDNDVNINPEGSEICDEIDNDCDGLIDDEDDSVNTANGNTYFIDADGDGEGSPNGNHHVL